jgi:hypothetical protein
VVKLAKHRITKSKVGNEDSIDPHIINKGWLR